MLAWMNRESLQKTLELGEAVYYSRSRDELWHKGATSGSTQRVVEMRIDCDQDAVLLKVRQTGGACHTKDPGTGHTRPGCYYRVVTSPDTLEFVV